MLGQRPLGRDPVQRGHGHEDEPSDPVGPVQGRLNRSDTAQRIADQRERAERECLGGAQQVAGVVGGGVPVRGFVRATAATQVERQGAVRSGERRDQVIPGVVGPMMTVGEDDRLPAPGRST